MTMVLYVTNKSVSGRFIQNVQLSKAKIMFVVVAQSMVHVFQVEVILIFLKMFKLCLPHSSFHSLKIRKVILITASMKSL